jgi:UPF0271 protein
MDKTIYILDASAFINGYEPKQGFNYTVSDITHEVKDLQSQIRLNQAIDEGKLVIKDPRDEFKLELDKIIKESGDSLRLSEPDKNLIALALDIKSTNDNIKVLTDDYSIQNVLRIIKIPYGSIITEGIHGVYNWVKTCNGCKREYPDDYPYDDCEVCGSSLFKRRIKK